MAKQQPNLAALLADTAGSTRRKPVPESEEQDLISTQQAKLPHKGAKPITVHFPQSVRDQLRLIAAEQGRPMQSVIAEAYNDLFAKYGKPEIAPKVQTQ
jgi:hypothetical protein